MTPSQEALDLAAALHSAQSDDCYNDCTLCGFVEGLLTGEEYEQHALAENAALIDAALAKAKEEGRTDALIEFAAARLAETEGIRFCDDTGTIILGPGIGWDCTGSVHYGSHVVPCASSVHRAAEVRGGGLDDDCDSCGARGFRLTYSAEHGAHFCDGCFERETGEPRGE